ncbi:heat shock factor protein 5 [Scomber scombrus]|uniref:Heat shock factor protein 5 n=1 Tax=Scomber scombrus TaxID=13677 RepID=A0AAV1PKA2_SCOSC
MDAADISLPDCINPNNFPAKLWRLVNSRTNRAICWDNGGEVIIIDQQMFEKQILTPESITTDNVDAFKTTNFSSFVRQLNLYGFRKADPANTTTPTKVVNGTFHHFFNPNFKRNHPELLVNLRRLTVDNKAKLQAGLSVNCRPPSRYQRLSGGDDVSAGSSSLLDSKDSAHPYYSIKAQSSTVHNGTPVPPRYLIRGAALPPSVFASDKGIPLSLSHHYTGVASSPNALHIPQGLLAHANHANHNFTTFNARNAQYQPGYYSPGCQCYHPNLVASHMKASCLPPGQFPSPSYYQAAYPVDGLCHGDQSQDFHYKENLEMKKCEVNLETIFQIADEVMQTPNNCLVRVVTPEKPGNVSLNTCSPVVQVSPQSNKPGSTRKASPLCAGPIIVAVSGNIDLVKSEQQEESVVSVHEQMPEDAVFEVTSDDAKDTEVTDVEVGGSLSDSSPP